MALIGSVFVPFLNSQLINPIDFDNDTIKVMLVKSTYTFNPAHEFRSDITDETTGTNYITGGSNITSIVTNTVDTTVTVTGADTTFAGASTSPFVFRAAIVYKDTGNAATDPVISMHDFDTDQSNNEQNVVLRWSTNFIVAYSTVNIGRELSDLVDVNTSTPTNRNVLVADGVDWESRVLVEADVSNLQAYLLNITGEPIDDLSDVVIITVGDNELLAFDIGTGNWINQTPAEAGISVTGHTHLEADITDLQPYLTDVVLDTTPQLGGNLDVQANTIITSTVNGDITLDPNGTGDVVLGNYTLDGDQTVGVGQDDFVLTYDDATGVISLKTTGFTVTELSDLTDVNTSTPTNRFVLVADGTDFESRLLVETDISNLQAYLLDITGENIVDLSDVVIIAVGDNELLVFDTGTGNWINQTPAEAGISVTGHTHTESDITDLQAYILDITGEPLSDLSDTTITAITANEVLKWSGTAWINNTLAEAGISATGHTHTESDITDLGAYLENVSEDTTPQLGGSLDVNGNPIISNAGGNITLTPNGTGNVDLGNFEFNADQTVGVGQDNFVLTYDNTSDTIQLEAAAAAFPLLAPDGTAGAPSYSFSGATNTGIFKSGGNNLAFSIGGQLSLTLRSDGLISVVTMKGPDGGPGDPTYSFTSSLDAGMYSDSADVIKWSTQGQLKLSLSTTALTSTVPIFAPAATTAIPSIRLPHGTAPTSPTNGDLWTTSSEGFLEINGETKVITNECELIASGTAAAVASLDFTDLTTTYKSYRLILSNVSVVTDTADFNFEVSTDNGISYKTGVTDYSWILLFARIRATGGPATIFLADFSDAMIPIMPEMGNLTNEKGACEINIYDPLSTADHTRITAQVSYLNQQPELRTGTVAGTYLATTAVNAFRVIPSTGNIATITFQLYGYR